VGLAGASIGFGLDCGAGTFENPGDDAVLLRPSDLADQQWIEMIARFADIVPFVSGH
jgi:hypothetical protein